MSQVQTLRQQAMDLAEIAQLTRSILHRSAASLAVECGESEQAERLIAAALRGNPPKEIAAELKEIFIANF